MENTKQRKTTNGDFEPQIIEDLGDGTYHYNFDAEPNTTEDGRTDWNYNQVRLNLPVNVNEIQAELNKQEFKHEAIDELQRLEY